MFLALLTHELTLSTVVFGGSFTKQWLGAFENYLYCLCGYLICVWIVMEELEAVMIGKGVRWMAGEWKKVDVPYLLDADDLVLFGESEENLRRMIKVFVKLCKMV